MTCLLPASVLFVLGSLLCLLFACVVCAVISCLSLFAIATRLQCVLRMFNDHLQPVVFQDLRAVTSSSCVCACCKPADCKVVAVYFNECGHVGEHFVMIYWY